MKTFAAYINDEEIRLESSSGGVFSLMAQYIYSLSGVVYGVAMADDLYSAEFIRVIDETGLKRLRGSKYLQAKVGNTYKLVKTDLEEGKNVLFSGTGCQVNGLKGFLQKEYQNLVCVDVICHGVPSPALWKEYVHHQEGQYGKLESVSFRCKDGSWTDFEMKENQIYISQDKDPYMQMFLRNCCLRPSCYRCTAKQVKMSDLTIGDFWGIDSVAPQMNDGKGTSLIIVRSKKGEDTLDKIKNCMTLKEVSYNDAVRGNPSEYKSVDKPQLRGVFFDDMKRLSFDELSKKYAAPVKIGVKMKIKRFLKKIRNAGRGGLGIRQTEIMECVSHLQNT